MFCDFFFTFLSLKNDLNIPSKSNKQKIYFVGILKVNDKNSRIRIHTQNVMDAQHCLLLVA